MTEKPDKAPLQRGQPRVTWAFMVIGLGVGIAMGVATDALAVWMSLGIAAGVVIGCATDYSRGKKNG